VSPAQPTWLTQPNDGGLLAHIWPQSFDTSSFASMNRASSSALLTVSTSALARINFAGPLPMATQLSLLADAGHVIARIVDGAQRAAVFGREGPV
jgi:hypothetical protein